MKRMAALVLALAVGLSTVTAADTDVLEELRRGEHFDRTSLFGTGADVLARALAGDHYLIANLGRYFENGERGFPANAKVATRLYEAAYRRGDWLSALNLARAAETAGDVRAAYRYYRILFVAGGESEEIAIRTGQRASNPFGTGPTHWGYAGMEFLERTGAILQEDIPALLLEAAEEAMSRGFVRDCEGVATRQCVDIADDLERAGCRIKAEDRCYLGRKR